MPSYSHKKLVESIQRIDQPPQQDDQFRKWIGAGQHLHLLANNAESDEIIVYGSGPYTFICSLVVPNEALEPLDKGDLLRWSGGLPSSHIAGYAHGGGRPDMWIDRACSEYGSKALRHGHDLVFQRDFEGWAGKDRNYFEVWQEYAHLAGIHWRPEHRAYCRYDENGDLDHVVSVTARNEHDVALVSFTWPKLEEYLAVSKSSLVRLFDFTLLRRELFSHWGSESEALFDDVPSLFYRQKFSGDAAYTRGVQIIRPRQLAPEVMDDMKNGWSGRREKEYVEFIAEDWRNQKITKISTDPKQTTNYFAAEGNSLPFELSPAFFRAEVLSKYKTDRDKYRVSDRGIECRAAWSLRGFDVNEAGQVHVYICDLRDLPHAEQLHWLSFNEKPKAGISERALVNDFKGEFVSFQHPREEICFILRRWHKEKVAWWTLRDEKLLDRANPPLASSKDEWADAFMDLSQLVIEGFQVGGLRQLLATALIDFDQKEQSIRLLERLVTHTEGSKTPVQMTGLRGAQLVRSKVKGHAGSSEGQSLADDAITQHGSFGEHFKYVCGMIAAELEIIERSCEVA